MKRYFLLIGVFIHLSTFLVDAQSVDSILNRYNAKVSNGDIENWQKIKTAIIISEGGYSQSGYDNTPDFNPKISRISKHYWEWPDKSLLELYEDSVVVSRYYTIRGKHIFFLGNMPPVDPSPPDAENYGFGFDPMFIEFIRKKSKTITWRGIKNFDTGDCHAIEFKTKSKTWIVYFNVDTFLVDYFGGDSPDESLMLTRVEDYQPVDNFLIAMKHTSMRNGNIFTWQLYREIKLNASIDPKIFEYNQHR